MMKGFLKSWRTTVAGVSLALGMLGMAISAQFDDDPETKPEWELVISAILAAGGAIGLGSSARDSGVTSRQAGAE